MSESSGHQRASGLGPLPPSNRPSLRSTDDQTVPLTREGDDRKVGAASFPSRERSDQPVSGGSAERGIPPNAPDPLAGHLRDAIRLNRSRRAGYRQRGGRRADWLSRALVASERALRPVARRLDAWAARFDVPILAAELSDMDAVPPADQTLPTLPRSDAPPPRLRPLRRQVARALSCRDLTAAADALRCLLHALRQSERADGRRRALAVHVAESAGVMAARGAEYARQTSGATAALSVRLVWGHLALLPFALALDCLAAPVHARGVGLFVNDLPPILFPDHV